MVPPTDAAYADIDRLVELGAVDSIIIGQRPYSRREIARIARVTREKFSQSTSGMGATSALVSGLLARLEDRFGNAMEPSDGVSFVPLDAASAFVSTTNAPRRGPSVFNSTLLQATIEPLGRRRPGVQLPRGQAAGVELGHRLDVASWLSVQASERFESRRPEDSTVSSSAAEVLTLFARARYRNLAVSAGREEFAWSQHVGDGLFLASDAPALDQLSLASDRPFALPGFLRHAGPVMGTIILADLGPSADHSYSRLLTYKLSMQPTDGVELGGTFLDHFGGRGARQSSFTDRVIDFLPFIDIFRRHNYADTTRQLDVESDKLLGIDGRWRIRRLGGTTISGEWLIDDFDVHRLGALLTTVGSQYLNVMVPLGDDPSWTARISAKHMGISTYTHSGLRDGISTRGRLLGDELGPDAKSFAGALRWTPGAESTLELEYRRAVYSSAVYDQFYSDASMTYDVVRKVSKDPDETRDRVLVSIVTSPDALWSLQLRAGAELTENFAFSGGRRRAYVADVVIRFAQ